MNRYHTTSEGNIPFTVEEEAEWDAREAAYVPPEPVSATTKEQLLAEVQMLLAKIEALA